MQSKKTIIMPWDAPKNIPFLSSALNIKILWILVFVIMSDFSLLVFVLLTYLMVMYENYSV